MDEATMLAEGWKRVPAVRYSAAIGPTFVKQIDGKVTAALLAQEHLANDNLGIVHGGAMMTFADMAMGIGVGHATGGTAMFVTAQLAVQFTAAARIGELITCQPEVVRKTSSMVFMRGLIVADERTVASVDAIFKLLDAKQMQGMKTG
ncbi:MAG: PaaI family thioesterase [Novosphingobium sp.]